ncbi:MAG: phosphate acetyltransferase [candidate division Zixibacteria bacterium]|nr:phosphate acetyltransferase [candidate division Zixibacteria bacterium]NIR66427.1 phosphate acetyltransferase [candidate division Zixibacteria bacterium]NIS18071.1 phosphate acetyltransferase [candidate division Zixibacteria bacterium]NIS48017.1 phosphate acetyltransferase [candidate division Zixibacteria bacterium]NIT54351.1 phosphate acetyltransferase [candidate division Zixibacteria bacterium]
MSILDKLQEKAKGLGKHIVLPEGDDRRTIEAAKTIIDEGIAKLTILGTPKIIEEHAKEVGFDLSSVKVIEPSCSDDLDRYADEFVKLRAKKGLTKEQALAKMKEVLYFGDMIVHMDEADGCVAGAAHTTGDVIRAGLHVIGLAPGISSVSSCFMMVVPEFMGRKDKVFLFADGAVLPNPTPEQLGAIAVSTARTMKVLAGEEPRVAMLSFSTKGSAEHPDITKVRMGLEEAKKIDPKLIIDGELQVDAAIIPKIANSKAPGSPVEGKANVLVFPDLDAGNIAYKIVQRLASAEAIGPIIQGLAKPANDLSRGCSASDIVNVVAIASILSTIE